MRRLLRIAIAGICFLSVAARAAEPIPVADPDRFSAEALQMLAAKGSHQAAAMIAHQLGRPDAVDDLQRLLQFFDDKTFDFSRKVVDKEYGGGLRQIVHYAYVKGTGKSGFLYFRFNYKMSSAGWLLANFMFKDETNELFPKDFVQP